MSSPWHPNPAQPGSEGLASSHPWLLEKSPNFHGLGLTVYLVWELGQKLEARLG